jgi:hypothetical protein
VGQFETGPSFRNRCRYNGWDVGNQQVLFSEIDEFSLNLSFRFHICLSVAHCVCYCAIFNYITFNNSQEFLAVAAAVTAGTAATNHATAHPPPPPKTVINLGTRWKCVVRFTPRPLYPGEPVLTLWRREKYLTSPEFLTKIL